MILSHTSFRALGAIPCARRAMVASLLLVAAASAVRAQSPSGSLEPLAGERVRLSPVAALHPTVGWVRRQAGDTLWIASCRSERCEARRTTVARDARLDVSPDYDRIAGARHRMVLGGLLGGLAYGYLKAGGPGKLDEYAGYYIFGGGIIGFLGGAVLAEPLHPERWVPARRR